jgi:hypothetical protein
VERRRGGAKGGLSGGGTEGDKERQEKEKGTRAFILRGVVDEDTLLAVLGLDEGSVGIPKVALEADRRGEVGLEGGPPKLEGEEGGDPGPRSALAFVLGGVRGVRPRGVLFSGGRGGVAPAEFGEEFSTLRRP